MGTGSPAPPAKPWIKPPEPQLRLSSEYRAPDERPCRIRRDTGRYRIGYEDRGEAFPTRSGSDRKHRPRQARRTDAIFHLLSSSRTDCDSHLIAPLDATPHGPADDHAPPNQPAVPRPKPKAASSMPAATRPTPSPRRIAHPVVHIGMMPPAESLDLVPLPMALDRARPAPRNPGAPRSPARTGSSMRRARVERFTQGIGCAGGIRCLPGRNEGKRVSVSRRPVPALDPIRSGSGRRAPSPAG